MIHYFFYIQIIHLLLVVFTVKAKKKHFKQMIGNFNGAYILASNLVIVLQKVEG